MNNEGARNIEFVGHTDQGGRGDGVQVMVAGGYAYVGTRVQRGIMVTDVREARRGDRAHVSTADDCDALGQRTHCR